MKKATALDVARLFGSRFLALYLFLFFLPFPFNYMPVASSVAFAYEGFWRAAVPWLSSTVLGHEGVAFVQTGSGDTQYHYLLLLCCLCIAFISAALWTAADYHAYSHRRCPAA